MNIFLSEYYLLTGDKEVLPKIEEMAFYLAKGQISAFWETRIPDV